MHGLRLVLLSSTAHSYLYSQNKFDGIVDTCLCWRAIVDIITYRVMPVVLYSVLESD